MHHLPLEIFSLSQLSLKLPVVSLAPPFQRLPSTIMSDLCLGKFKLTKSDNFDKFLEALGIGVIKRKLATSTNPEIEITKSGDQFHVKTKTALKNTEFKFTPGVEFEEDRQDDVKVKSLITVDGDKWTQTQTPLEGDKVVTIVRNFEASGMSVTASVSGVSSERYYTRQ